MVEFDVPVRCECDACEGLGEFDEIDCGEAIMTRVECGQCLGSGEVVRCGCCSELVDSEDDSACAECLAYFEQEDNLAHERDHRAEVS